MTIAAKLITHIQIYSTLHVMIAVQAWVTCVHTLASLNSAFASIFLYKCNVHFVLLQFDLVGDVRMWILYFTSTCGIQRFRLVHPAAHWCALCRFWCMKYIARWLWQTSDLVSQRWMFLPLRRLCISWRWFIPNQFPALSRICGYCTHWLPRWLSPFPPWIRSHPL